MLDHFWMLQKSKDIYSDLHIYYFDLFSIFELIELVFSK